MEVLLTGFVYPILFIVFVSFIISIRRVPSNTIIIIDRNSHYLKTKRKGFYFLGANDKITSKISTSSITENYSNVFVTHDNYYYRVDFKVTYAAEDVEMVLSALQDSRRSIYDIANCAIETVFGALLRKDLVDTNNVSSLAFRQIESTLEPFYLDAIKISLSFVPVMSTVGEATVFKKHISGLAYDSLSDDNPIK